MIHLETSQSACLTVCSVLVEYLDQSSWVRVLKHLKSPPPPPLPDHLWMSLNVAIESPYNI